MSRTITEKEYEEYRRLKTGLNDWITEAEAMELTGWGRLHLNDMRRAGKLKTRSLFGRKIQYSKSHIEGLFSYQN